MPQLWWPRSFCSLFFRIRVAAVWIDSCIAPSEQEDASLFGSLFTEMASYLTRDRWKHNPSVVTIFTTCLFHIRFPYTSNHLNKMLPTSLLLTDDIQTHNKVLGLRCLHHITSNVSATELCRYGRAQIICSALEQQLYTREEAVLRVILPCALDILQALEKGESGLKYSHCHHTQMDGVLERLLTDMELEQQLVHRRIYAEHLPKYVNVMGIRVVRAPQKTDCYHGQLSRDSWWQGWNSPCSCTRCVEGCHHWGLAPHDTVLWEDCPIPVESSMWCFCRG